MRDALTDSDNFTLKMPAEIPAVQKSLILAAALLIDYMYYEK